MPMLAACALFMSCEDNRLNGIPANGVYMARSGAQVIPVYDLGEDAIVPVSVVKSGFYNMEVNAKLDLGSDVDIALYNEENATGYVMLPENCYSFTPSTLTFGEKDLYATSPVTVVVDAVKDLVEANPGIQYALPIKLSNATIEINKARNLSLFIYQIKKAEVSMSVAGESAMELDDLGITNFAFDLSVPFTNKWDLTCNFDMSKVAFDEFNATKGGVYEQVPADAVVFPTSVVIPAGQQVVSVQYSVDKSKLGESNYALVFNFTSVESEKVIEVNEKTSFYAGTMSSAKDLDRKSWTVGDCFETEPNEGAEANLLDGDMATYWHSKWSGGSSKPTVETPAWCTIVTEKAYKIVSVQIAPRGSNATPGASYCTGGVLEVSMDNVTYTQVGFFNLLPKAGFQNFPVTPTVAKYIRVKATGPNFAQFAEIGAQGGAAPTL